MDEENDSDDLDEYGKDLKYLTDKSHVQENTEDIQREKRDDRCLYRLYDVFPYYGSA